jgi:hypothetical protein
LVTIFGLFSGWTHTQAQSKRILNRWRLVFEIWC